MTRPLLIAAASIVGVALVALAGLPVYVFPTVESTPAHADVILVLGPPTSQRMSAARDLVTAGVSDRILVSVPPSVYVPGTRDHEKFAACTRDDPVVHCFQPDPTTTRGEARELGRLAERNGWRSAIAITMTPHIARARMIIQRCFSGTLVMHTADAPLSAGDWIYQYGYQTAGFVRAGLERGC